VERKGGKMKRGEREKQGETAGKNKQREWRGAGRNRTTI
jgi:hypothetical protein